MRSFCTRSSMLLAVTAVISGCQQDTTSPSTTETPALAASTASTLFFTQVSAGDYHTCGVTPENRAYCWGEDGSGQLGNGPGTSSNKPVPVAGGLRFLQVSAGSSFTCGITTSNKAYCWGLNSHGQLGIDAFQGSSVPVAVAGGRSFRNIRAGYDHTCAVTLFNVGFCWGKNRFGELGVNSTVRRSYVPVRVVGGLQWNRIVAGGHYSCGITTDQRAYCWGDNSSGQLGTYHTSHRKPVPVAGGLRFRLVVAGGGGYEDLQYEMPAEAHTCGVTTENKGYCWGLGPAMSNTPAAIPGTTRRWKQVIAGSDHTCGVTLADVAFCWGRNDSGQNGTGNTTSSNTPVRVAGGHVFTAVTTGVGERPYGGGRHSCGLTSDNRVYCWGSNQAGQLGNGTNTYQQLTPVAVVGP